MSGLKDLVQAGEHSNDLEMGAAGAVASRPSATARLDRLPLTAFHWRILALLSFCFFFEFGDINTFAFAAPAIRTQWGLSIANIGLITSGTFFGMFLGAIFGGWFADHVGRKTALIAATLWFSIFSLFNGLTWEPMGLFVARMLTGFGLAGMTAIGITYIAEMIPATKRGTFQGLVMAIGLCGIPATAFVAWLSISAVTWGWRLVFAWGAVAIIFPLLARRLEESPRWYERRGRFAEADAVLDRIESQAQLAGYTIVMPTPSPVSAHDGGFAKLFVSPVRGRTLMLTIVWIFQTIGYYGFSAWVPTLLVERGFTLVDSLGWATAMQFGGLPGAFLAAFAADRWQRRWLIAAVALAIGACGLAYGLTFQAFYIVVFGSLVTMFIWCFAPMLYAYTAECFPTEIRSSGTGFTYGIGRLANTASPLAIAFLFTNYGYLSVFVYIAACWAIVALAVGLFGPLTKGRTL
jgi:putative MFS transporter